jgi:hypothetical protein
MRATYRKCLLKKTIHDAEWFLQMDNLAWVPIVEADPLQAASSAGSGREQPQARSQVLRGERSLQQSSLSAEEV